jgi:hypothetical protein
MIAAITASFLAQHRAVAVRGHGKDGASCSVYGVDQQQNHHMLPVFAEIIQ